MKKHFDKKFVLGFAACLIVSLLFGATYNVIMSVTPAAAGNIPRLNMAGQLYDNGTWSSQFTAKEVLALAAINAATTGSMMYHDGIGWAVLPIAPDTYILKSNGTIPVWTAP